jgi:small-conductance mechanosensitive channel
MNEIVSPTFEQVAMQLPVLIVCLVGIVLALVFWSRSPMVSAFVLISASLLLLVSIAYLFASPTVLNASSKEGWTSERTALIVGAISVVYTVIRAAGLGLLLAAAFTGRPAPSESLEELFFGAPSCQPTSPDA